MFGTKNLQEYNAAFPEDREAREDLLGKRFLRDRIVTVTSNYKPYESRPFLMEIYPSQRCTEGQNELHIYLFH